MEDRVPVTIVTGALGSGKTTLLKHIMKNQPEGKKICVVQNEVSEFVVEDALYVGSSENQFEKYIELPNGCVCCSVRDDFVQALETLSNRDTSFDHIIVETSGLADPGSLASIFWVDDALEGRIFLDAIVAIVDAHFLKNTLELFSNGDEEPLPIRQIAFADLVIVNKTDLLTNDQATQDNHDIWDLPKVLEFVGKTNPLARIVPTVRCQVNVSEHVLDRRAFDLTHPSNALAQLDKIGLTPNDPNEHHHHHPATHKHGEVSSHSHGPDIKAVGFELLAADVGFADMKNMCLWLDSLLYEKQVPGGGEVFRFKALVAAADQTERVVFQGVHNLFDHENGLPWDTAPFHRLVFIGKRLDADKLKEAFLGHVVKL